MTEQDENPIGRSKKDFFKSIGLLSENVPNASASIFFDNFNAKKPAVRTVEIKDKKK